MYSLATNLLKLMIVLEIILKTCSINHNNRKKIVIFSCFWQIKRNTDVHMLIKIKLSYEVGKKMNGDAMFLVNVCVCFCVLFVFVFVLFVMYICGWNACVLASTFFVVWFCYLILVYSCTISRVSWITMGCRYGIKSEQ